MFLLLPAALGASTTVEASLTWDQVGLALGGEDAIAQGVEHLVAGPDGLLALYDSVLREVVVLDGGEVAWSFPVRLTTDLVFTATGELATIDTPAREVALWSVDGVELARVALPALVPTHVSLAIDGTELVGVDLFGNHHAVAGLDHGELVPSARPPLEEIASEVSWIPESRTMVSEGFSLELPEAVKASGQRQGDWLVVDAVKPGAGPIQVSHTAWHVPTGQSVELPMDRLYAPRGEITHQAGDLLVLVPRLDGPQVLRVSP